MNIPSKITAGDTLKFTDSVADYLPADGWVLSYVLVAAGEKLNITATDNGDGTHLVNVPATTTVNWAAGEYQWQRYATKAPDRFSIGAGMVDIDPDFASADATNGLDGRSDWQQILDGLIAAYKKLTTTSATVVTASYRDRTTTYRSVDELIVAINHAKREVKREKTEQAIRDGLPTGNKIYFRA